MEYQISQKAHMAILALKGEVDLQYSPQAREQILLLLEKYKHLLVDLSGVSYIDSSGVASLVEGYQKACQCGGSFGLTGLSDSARQVLQLARLDEIFPIFDSVETALKAG